MLSIHPVRLSAGGDPLRPKEVVTTQGVEPFRGSPAVGRPAYNPRPWRGGRSFLDLWGGAGRGGVPVPKE